MRELRGEGSGISGCGVGKIRICFFKENLLFI